MLADRTEGWRSSLRDTNMQEIAHQLIRKHGCEQICLLGTLLNIVFEIPVCHVGCNKDIHRPVAVPGVAVEDAFRSQNKWMVQKTCDDEFTLERLTRHKRLCDLQSEGTRDSHSTL